MKFLEKLKKQIKIGQIKKTIIVEEAKRSSVDNIRKSKAKSKQKEDAQNNNPTPPLFQCSNYYKTTTVHSLYLSN